MTDKRPAYINQFETATDSVKAMLPAGITHPVMCLICNGISEYNDRTTVVINRAKRDGYVCGATCATRLINKNTANNTFTFITAGQEITVAGRKTV